MPTNNFLPFAIGGGANVEAQGSYAVDPLLATGNQPGIAISAFNNKALRQANVVTSQMAQFIANTTGTDVLDDTLTAKLLAQVFAAFSRKTPVITSHLSGSGNHNLTYKFQVASANATTGATYSDGTTVFTVSSTISAALELAATGGAAPAVSGTLTKTGGTGDSTITYYAARAPIYMRVRAVGGGGGGGGSDNGAANGGNGTAGAATTFGTTLISAGGGAFGSGSASSGASGGAGGSSSLGVGPVGLAISGGSGGAVFFASTTGFYEVGPLGGVSAFGGNGSGGNGTGVGGPIAAAANSGSGGGGGGGPQGGGSGAGGGAGGYVDAIISGATLLASFAYSVGTGGNAGAAGSGGYVGSAGGSGVILVEEYYQ